MFPDTQAAHSLPTCSFNTNYVFSEMPFEMMKPGGVFQSFTVLSILLKERFDFYVKSLSCTVSYVTPLSEMTN